MAHLAILIYWTATRGSLNQSTIHLDTMFFACCSQSDNTESASQALPDLKLQLTPVLGSSQPSVFLKTPPPVTGYIGQADLYGTAPLCIQRTHFPDSWPIDSLNNSWCSQTLLLPSPTIGNSNFLTKGAQVQAPQSGLQPSPQLTHLITPPFPIPSTTAQPGNFTTASSNFCSGRLHPSAIYLHYTGTPPKPLFQTAIYTSLLALSLPAKPLTHYGISHTHQCLFPSLTTHSNGLLLHLFPLLRERTKCRSNRIPPLL
jgi:hypothetical protein